nr:PREDICTED: immunoglobulin superfamily member 6 [Lepisosteus oculatus]
MARVSSNSLDRLCIAGLLLALSIVQEACPADGCSVQVSQPGEMSVVEDTSSVTIPCAVTAPGCPGHRSVYWFVFRASSHEQLQLHTHGKYAPQGDSLDISPVHANDSGVYYCGIAFSGSTAPGARSTGKGTVLLVRGRLHVANPQGKALLSTVIVLLFLYNLAIIILLIHKKGGRSKILCWRAKDDSSRKNNSTWRNNFRAVVQEMYRGGEMHRDTKGASEEKPPLAQPEDSQTPPIMDDIYQNM